jgi:molybdate transport repressor ModE-like protein
LQFCFKLGRTLDTVLDMNRLRVLHEVARSGSFSAAARALRITPSAVAQQIGALERSVGLSVVNRSPRGVRVTEPGRLLVEATANVVADLAQVERQLDRYTRGGVGRLAVATFSSAGQTLLPAALTPLTRRTDVEITVQDADVDESIPLLRDGGVDLAVTCHFFNPSPPRVWVRDLEHLPLLREEIYAVVQDGHPLAECTETGLDELCDEWWILGTSYCGQQVDQLCNAAGFEPRMSCRSNDYTFVQTLVAAGVGVALIPALAVAGQLPGTRVLRVRPTPYRYVGVTTRRERSDPPLAAELVRLLRTAARSLDIAGVTPVSR